LCHLLEDAIEGEACFDVGRGILIRRDIDLLNWEATSKWACLGIVAAADGADIAKRG